MNHDFVDKTFTRIQKYSIHNLNDIKIFMVIQKTFTLKTLCNE